MEKYTFEKDGQIDFYNQFLPRINPDITVEEIISNNNDGVLNGNLIEFKLSVKDLNEVLFQCIKYLSALRIRGIPVPKNIVVISLNSATAYLYDSGDYLAEIEKVYTGGASKNNSGFIGSEPKDKLDYSNDIQAEKLITILKSKDFTKINIDENCIVGWASAFYKAKPTARKEDFLGDEKGKHKTIGEIRNPFIFKDYIVPYRGETNIKFNYLMDKLNDTILKKNLGAFYTHTLYAQKAAELVRQAIKRVPEGNDYIILDRCAGTGNLESALTDEELSHCIVSTVEYYEYKVLQELFGSKVRHIIPPFEEKDTFNAGLVNGADALTKEYLDNEVIKQYVDNPKCSVILFENPPYAETTSIEHQKAGKGKESSTWKQSFVVTEMKKEVKGTVSNDLGNAFIWSAFKYYLRQDTDSYIVFSPVKYWKAQHLISKKFINGYAFNRRHFHTNIDACIMCALWSNEDSDITEFELEGYDIDRKTNEFLKEVKLSVKQIHSGYSEVFFDKRKPNYLENGGIVVGLDGLESNLKTRVQPIDDKNVICYLDVHSSGFDNPDLNCSMVVTSSYRGNGFFVRKDNYLQKLPMFAAARYITYNREWTERARIMKSADKADEFNNDVKSGKVNQFLLKCLLFTCIEMQNHCRTFTGSDGRFYRNELCLDTTNGETVASKDIKKMNPDETEKKILELYKVLLNHIKETKEYNSSLTYGIYQIYAEIDTSYTDEITGKTIYNNIQVHSDLQAMKELCKSYYNKEIVPTLFEYEFLK
jgi:hypothetical protein